jgi:multidrug efflux pump subunit AcrB
MDEVGRPVVAISPVLIAVFVPTAFILGYQAILSSIRGYDIRATAISAFNSLTLSLALAVLFKSHSTAPPLRCLALLQARHGF